MWREYFLNPFVLKTYAALCTVNSTIQYSIPAVLPKNVPEEINYTKITNRAKSKYRFITKHLEILESYQNKYWGTLAMSKYLPGGANA